MTHINSNSPPILWPPVSFSGTSYSTGNNIYDNKEGQDGLINTNAAWNVSGPIDTNQLQPSHNDVIVESSNSQQTANLPADAFIAFPTQQQGIHPPFQHIPPTSHFQTSIPTATQPHFIDDRQPAGINAPAVVQNTVTLQKLPKRDHSNDGNADASQPTDPPKRTKKKNTNTKREQYRSCDQCRSAKSACDLKLEAPLVDGIPAKACSGCARREIFCTALWLERMLTQREQKRKKNAVHEHQNQQQARQANAAPYPTTKDQPPAIVVPAGQVNQIESGTTQFLTPSPINAALPLVSGNIANSQQPMWQHLYALQTYNSHTLPHSKMEQSLGKDLMMDHLERNKFKIFYETFEIPFSHWLGQECIPPPYRAGLAIMNDSQTNTSGDAYAGSMHSSPNIGTHRGNEALQRVLNKAMLETGSDAIGKCSFASAPFLLSSVYILDALMDSKRFRGSRSPRSPLYSAQIESALHSAVLASASQYGSQSAENLEAQKHMTATAWYKAKKELFDLISDTWSFRLALGLLIFGMTTPPTPEDGRVDHSTSELYQNTLFAATEACQRLRQLCQHVRRIISRCRKERRSAPVDSDITELLGALEWLAIMIDTVKMVTYRTNVSNPLTIAAISSADSNEDQTDSLESNMDAMYSMPIMDADDSDDFDDSDQSDDVANNILLLSRLDLRSDGSNDGSLPSSSPQMQFASNDMQASSSKSPSLDSQSVSLSRWEDVKMWNMIIERTRQTSMQARVQITQTGSIDTELLLLTIRRATSLKILLWKAVADYANLSRCEKYMNGLLKTSATSILTFGQNVVEQDEAYQTIVEIIRLWHSIFGEMAKTAMDSFASLPKSGRSMLSFVCNHVALGTLHFFNIAEAIQRDLYARKKRKLSFQHNSGIKAPLNRVPGSHDFLHDPQSNENRDTKHEFSAQHRSLRLNAAEHISFIAELNNVYADQDVDFSVVNMFPGEKKVTEAVLSASGNAYHPDFWHHPFISMFLQAQHMAAYELLQEAQAALSLQGAYDGRPLPSLLRSADVCLIAIQRMSSGLISVPRPAIETKMQLEVLRAMRASFGF
ncbi:uncharacterized protein FA14DRAFT_160020 [Meira miltonrushii]|uniref:Zn(2)-C6 fungal-type domain-containing protein n=1 Tax=Meira miltonrushii TaxID=1280837 RepID=A0A316VLJ2_9BASI|nr:uncharacterized protein FA14DRAFT_160020 [Meira miltonrushii]PWN38462.1 hypothetical protein FA14DRAFT_160020 [Meira miltonrushii]